MKDANISLKINLTTKKRKPFRFRTINKLQLYSMCIIPVLLVFVFSYLPLVGLLIAFKQYRFDLGVFSSPWVGFKNFEIFLLSNDFTRIAWNTISLNLSFIAISTFCSVLLAVLLFNLKSRASTKVYQTVLITPNFISWVVAGYMTYAFLNPSVGFLNRIITAFGGNAVAWYSDAKHWPAILTIAYVWKIVGMNSVIYYASLMGIDTSLLEAAEIDGANSFQVVLHIIIPQILTLLTILTILAIGNIFKADFGLFYYLPRNVGALYEVTDVMDTYIYRTMRVVGDMSISTAAGLLQSVVGFVMVFVTNFVVKKIDPNKALF